jgi:acetyl-CoA carboxylase biotin carboxyl carrier protein
MAGSDAKRPADVFDLSRLRELIELMQQYDLRELDLKQDKQHIRLARGMELAAAPALAGAPQLILPSLGGDDQKEEPTPAEAPPHIVTINSPMVGTFYGRPNPDAEPFVKVGDHVNPDTVVCIIEAMKVFNEIPAEVSGQIVAVLAENEEAVEFGKPLFRVDTST